jgi:hypothetical protein
MISFGHDVAAAALFILLFTTIGIMFGSLLAPSQSKPLTLTLSMEASGRSAMLAIDCSTAISEQAELQPECLSSIFWFKPINNSLLSEHATQTANSNLPLYSKQATMPLLLEQAAQTAGKPLRVSTLTTIAIANCSFKLFAIQTDDDCSSFKWIAIQTTGKPSSSLIQTDNCSTSPSFIDDCSPTSPSLISLIQTTAGDFSVVTNNLTVSGRHFVASALIDPNLQSTATFRVDGPSLPFQSIDLSLPFSNKANNCIDLPLPSITKKPSSAS